MDFRKDIDLDPMSRDKNANSHAFDTLPGISVIGM